MEVNFWCIHSQILPPTGRRHNQQANTNTTKGDKFNSGLWRNKSSSRQELDLNPWTFQCELDPLHTSEFQLLELQLL